MNTPFWDAFWAGLACPTHLYATRHDENYKHVGRVDTAWKKVGGYISESIDLIKTDSDDRRGDNRAK